MMRLFKNTKKTSLKYIIGELLLLFAGINLAIWFNDWNASEKMAHSKQVAINKIVEELTNNQKDLRTVVKHNDTILTAYREFKHFFVDDNTIVEAKPFEMKRLLNQYPHFFSVKDSIFKGEGTYHYLGSTHINLEIPTLSEIAWKTATSMNISIEFEYDCLYMLESVYNLQRRVQVEIDKSANALQKPDLRELMIILDFINQLGLNLIDDYESVKAEIKRCGE